MRSLRLLALLLFTAAASHAAVGSAYTWSGAAGDHNFNNPANWAGGAVPPTNGSATLRFGDAADTRVTLPPVLAVSSIQFSNTAASSYTFDSGLATVLTVHNGINASAATGTATLAANVSLLFAGSQTLNTGAATLRLSGPLLGNGDLVKTGTGTLRLDGLNLLAGKLRGDAGALLFATPASVPTLGSVSSSATGYVGAENAAALDALLGRIEAGNFRGTLGLETAAGLPTALFASQIDVSALNQLGNIGTRTSALVTGEVKVAQGADYRFGGGDGTLTLESNLTSRGRNLDVKSAHGQPLTLVLRGTNTFTGTVNVLHSVLVLDAKHAVKTQPLALVGPGYIGATERFELSGTDFISRVNPGLNTQAIVGFDSSDPAVNRTVSDAIDLSVGGTRTESYYLGTGSRVTLTGAITPTTGDALYLTAIKGGHLTVASTLGANLPGLVVGQTHSFDPKGGTVELTGNNTYAGGTQVLGGTLRVSSNNALGLGGVGVANGATLDINHGVTFANAFTLSSGARLSGHGTLSAVGGSVIGPGAILSPGGPNAIGTLTFNHGLTLGPGARVELNIANATGTAGSGWDLINVATGSLTLAGSTPVLPITLYLSGLTPGAPVANFDANQSYSWLFLAATNINGFSADKFVFDTTGFGSALNGGAFLVMQGSGGLSINFTPVPEPGTYALFGLGLGLMALRHLRRRKAARG